MLYEMFLASGEDWLKSTLMINIRSKNNVKKLGKVVWLSKKELLVRYPVEMAEQLMTQKLQTKSMWMWHPDFQDVEEMRLFRCFDALLESTCEEFEREFVLESKGEVDHEVAVSLLENNGEALFRRGLRGCDTEELGGNQHGDSGGIDVKDEEKPVLPKPKREAKPKKEKLPAKLAQEMIAQAGKQIIEAKTWDAKLATAGIDARLRRAACEDMDKHVKQMEKMRTDLEAATATEA